MKGAIKLTLTPLSQNKRLAIFCKITARGVAKQVSKHDCLLLHSLVHFHLKVNCHGR